MPPTPRPQSANRNLSIEIGLKQKKIKRINTVDSFCQIESNKYVINFSASAVYPSRCQSKFTITFSFLSRYFFLFCLAFIWEQVRGGWTIRLKDTPPKTKLREHSIEKPKSTKPQKQVTQKDDNIVINNTSRAKFFFFFF